MPTKPNLDLLRLPLDIENLLIDLQPEEPEFWPPDKSELAELAVKC